LEKQNENVKIAIIDGVAIVLAAITGLFTIDFTKEGNIKIISVDVIKENQSKAIEVMIYNSSKKEAPLTSIEINASAVGFLNTIGSEKYLLEDLILSKDSSKNNIEGFTRNKNEEIKREIHGEIKFSASGGWNLALVIPIRESIKPEESKSLRILEKQILHYPNSVNKNYLQFNPNSSKKYFANEWIKGNGICELK
jgi:hypothetical protein